MARDRVNHHVVAAVLVQIGLGTVSAGQRIDAALTAAANMQPAADTRH